MAVFIRSRNDLLGIIGLVAGGGADTVVTRGRGYNFSLPSTSRTVGRFIILESVDV